VAVIYHGKEKSLFFSQTLEALNGFKLEIDVV